MDYLTDPRDKAACGLTPTLMAPRFGQMEPPPYGVHRYIIAANGLFLQAHSKALEVCIKVADTPALPYGEMKEYVRMAGGRIPSALYQHMQNKTVAACPDEWAGVVTYDPLTKGYQLKEPAIESASPGHITYRTAGYDDGLVLLDIHSHGDGPAYFSTTDDRSDAHGIYLSCVLGECKEQAMVTSTTRIVINGQFFPVAWTPWDS